MLREIHNVVSLNDGILSCFNVQLPSVCPYCNKLVGLDPIYSCYITDSQDNVNLYAIFLCSNCYQCYVAKYRVLNYRTSRESTTLISVEPQKYISEKEFPPYIKKLSPRFCEIYNQAYKAQHYELNELTGIGFRKALEFLVKDYAISIFPDEEAKIKSTLLSQCINRYIDSKRIKQLAIASAWLGNDETHYVKKIQEYNIEDLLAFIDAIVSFINSDLTASQAEKLINSKNTDINK